MYIELGITKICVCKTMSKMNYCLISRSLVFIQVHPQLSVFGVNEKKTLVMGDFQKDLGDPKWATNHSN